MISKILVLYNCEVVKVVFVGHLRIVSISFVFSKTWLINPLKRFRTCQSISDKNDICLVNVYFVLYFVCLFVCFFFLYKNAHTFGSRVQRPNQSAKLPPQSRSRSRSRVSGNEKDRDATQTNGSTHS